MKGDEAFWPEQLGPWCRDTQGQGTLRTELLWEKDYEVRVGDGVCSPCEFAERDLRM